MEKKYCTYSSIFSVKYLEVLYEYGNEMYIFFGYLPQDFGIFFIKASWLYSIIYTARINRTNSIIIGNNCLVLRIDNIIQYLDSFFNRRKGIFKILYFILR